MQNYLQRHESEWNEMESLLQRAGHTGRLASLTAEEINRLDVLYRTIAAQLAQVKTRTRDPALLHYLNGLTASAHGIIYAYRRPPVWKRTWHFLTHGFACEVMQQWRVHLASLLLMGLGVLVGYLATMRDPTAAYALMPAGELRHPGMTAEALMDILRGGREQDGGEKFVFASFLFQHNLRVGLLALGTGILAAIPTILLIVYNGMYLGAFAAVHTQAGIGLPMWAWILPHGITELGAVVLCGGAGLQLGRAVVCPGLRSRGDRLREAARSVVRIGAGVALMLVFAAVVESYVRQSHLTDAARLGFAGGTLLFWVAYFTHGALRNRRFHNPGETGLPPNHP